MFSFKHAPLLIKINFIVAIIFIIVIATVTGYTGYREKNIALDFAKEQVKDMSTFYFDSLNTMMLTGTMDQRSVLRDKILRRPGIKEARVVRGEPVKQQFGRGFDEEQPQDALDKRALEGENILLVEESAEGRLITVLTPFRATENTRNVNCLQCHNVPSGAVNGAIRISFSLSGMDQRIENELWIEVAFNATLLTIGLIMINLIVRRWVTKPLNNLIAVVQQRTAGDINARATVTDEDEVGKLALAFNSMADKVNESVTREHQAAEDLRSKVDHLLEVVSKAARGDLTGQIRLLGDDAIGELAQVIQIMINNIRLLLKEKHDAMAEIQEKVDRILTVVTKAADGDLTGNVDVHGDDAIGRLAGAVQVMIDNLHLLVSQVQQSGIQVSSSATEIAATAKEQLATMSQQAATVNDIVTTSTEISATAQNLLETMTEVATVSEDTTEFANSGKIELSTMEQTMNLVVDASQAIGGKLEALREKAASINTVVTTITKVADQTNLLSLNAAIEAEKAGEHGLGFSVVATEIRRLADQTAVASWDIEQLINKMQMAVIASAMSVEKFSEEVKQSVNEVDVVSTKLTRIIEQVEVLPPRFESVREGMQFQSQGAVQIKQAVALLNESAQQTVESLKHSESAIDKLNEAARGLQQGVRKFKV